MKTKLPLLMLFTLLFVFISFVDASEVQENDWFSTVKMDINPAYTISTGDLGDYWDSDPGFELIFSFPYLHGNLRALLINQPLTSNNIEQRPDMMTFHYGFGYAYLWDVSDRFNLSGGLDYVLYKMNAIDPGRNVDYRWQFDELEVGMSVNCNAQLIFTEKTGLNFGMRHTTIFTYKQTHFTFISAGVYYIVSTPEWLRGGLK